MRLGLFLNFAAITMIFATASFADVAPECLSYGRHLPVNNAQVLHWKRTTGNQFRERAHVTGVVTDVYADRNSHEHFQIRVGKRQEDTIEIIYNKDFGEIPAIRVGMTTEVCGDYITATAQSGPYPPSPDGAIIHWVHMNPSGRGHDPGYVLLDGKLYGQDASNAGPKPRPGPRQGRKPPRRIFEGLIFEPAF